MPVEEQKPLLRVMGHGLDQVELRHGLGQEPELQRTFVIFGCSAAVVDDTRAGTGLAAAVTAQDQRADGNVEAEVATGAR